MIAGVWGRKIGMTQVFEGDAVVPVTAINVDFWVVTGLKIRERDGYDAMQVGCIKDRFTDCDFSPDWVKQPKKYFNFIREIKLQESATYTVGDKVSPLTYLAEGKRVDVFGLTKGCGFAGAVKRHGFTGAPATHGSTMGNAPGSMSGPRTKGKVIKGKRLPGHMGMQQRAAMGLRVIKLINKPTATVLVKGSVPGKGGTLVFLRIRHLN